MAPIKKTQLPLGSTFLKAWREFAGLDQETAAEKLNVSRTLVSKIETGKSPYTQRTLEAAAKLYGASPAQLLAVDPNDKSNLWALFERANKTEGSERERVIRLIKAAIGDD